MPNDLASIYMKPDVAQMGAQRKMQDYTQQRGGGRPDIISMGGIGQEMAARKQAAMQMGPPGARMDGPGMTRDQFLQMLAARYNATRGGVSPQDQLRQQIRERIMGIANAPNIPLGLTPVGR